jgi:hypothetical protein
MDVSTTIMAHCDAVLSSGGDHLISQINAPLKADIVSLDSCLRRNDINTASCGELNPKKLMFMQKKRLVCNNATPDVLN